MSAAMSPCPGCGAELAASLVSAIRNPQRSESCPHLAEFHLQDVPDVHILDAAAAAIQRRMALVLSVLTRPAPPVPAPGRESEHSASRTTNERLPGTP